MAVSSLIRNLGNSSHEYISPQASSFLPNHYALLVKPQTTQSSPLNSPAASQHSSKEAPPKSQSTTRTPSRLITCHPSASPKSRHGTHIQPRLMRLREPSLSTSQTPLHSRPTARSEISLKVKCYFWDTGFGRVGKSAFGVYGVQKLETFASWIWECDVYRHI
jgi:hypothetical protein